MDLQSMSTQELQTLQVNVQGELMRRTFNEYGLTHIDLENAKSRLSLQVNSQFNPDM